MNDESIIQSIEKFVTDYFAAHGGDDLPYHDIGHTRSVVAAATLIGTHYQLKAADIFVLQAAAWFHDMGYCLAQGGAQHEQRGAELAKNFLKEKSVDETTIRRVEDCIMATQMPQQPKNLLGQIICDADLFHLGTDDFSQRNKQVRKEYESTHHIQVSKEAWRQKTIRFLQQHRYQTDYCQQLLEPKKQANLDKLILKQAKEQPLQINDSKAVGEPAPAPETDKEDKAEKPTRGIETMFRIAVTNHQRLSDMADKKASIMISVNSIIISVVIGMVVRKMEETQDLIIPTLILLTGCVTAVVFSVLATRPQIPNGYFTPDQLSRKTVNLLFFGNFYNMDYDKYYDGMQKVMADSEFLYASLIRDIYSQGKVLGKKYKLLRVSYTIFMITLVVTIVALAISVFYT